MNLAENRKRFLERVSKAAKMGGRAKKSGAPAAYATHVIGHAWEWIFFRGLAFSGMFPGKNLKIFMLSLLRLRNDITAEQFHRTVAKKRPFDIMIVGDDFKALTGVYVSTDKFTKEMSSLGYNCHNLHLKRRIKTAREAGLMAMRSDRIIFNSAKVFRHKNALWLINAILRRGFTPYFFLHETNWDFDLLAQRRPRVYRRLKFYLKRGHVLCVSGQQEKQVKRRFGVGVSTVVYENYRLFSGRPLMTMSTAPINLDASLNILMVGSLNARNGVELFSKLADLAKTRGRKWRFRWVGRGDIKSLYQSANVDWLGAEGGEDLRHRYLDADIVFISSVDDAMPLAALDAIQMYRRVVAYGGVGAADIIGDVAGCAVYQTHAPEHALKALEAAASEPIDLEQYRRLTNDFADMEAFLVRFGKAIGFRAPTTVKPGHTAYPFDPFQALAYIKSGPFADKLNRPLLIVGNGPSAAAFDDRRVPENPVVFRCNLFMFESKYRFGKHADAVCGAVHRRILQEALSAAIDTGCYAVDNFFYPMYLDRSALPTFRSGAAQHAKRFRPHLSHHNLIRLNPRLAPYFLPKSQRPMPGLPTQGMQMVATGCVLGFKKIYVIGVDFYQSVNARYAFTWPDYIENLVADKHKGGFETGVHGLDTEVAFLKLLADEYPDVEIYSLSEPSYLSTLRPVAPLLEKHWHAGDAIKHDAEFHARLRHRLQSPNRILIEASMKNGQLTGWAWNPADPTARQSLDLYIGERRVATLIADMYMKILDHNSVGDGECGFSRSLAEFDDIERGARLRLVSGNTSVDLQAVDGAKVRSSQ